MLAELDERTNMEGHMEGHKAAIRISAPEIKQVRLSFCDGSLDSFEAWAKKLPMANVGAAAKLLFQAIRELNCTQLKTLHRYKMLEIIRSQIYSICETLSKRFLNQSVMLTDNDLKIISLAQTLQNQLASGYKRIVLDELENPSKKGDGKKLITFAIHRAISDLNQTILRAYQLYSNPPKNAWLELHQLYSLAETKKIQQYSIKDSRAKYITSSSIFDIYVRALLLGCCKPNQLRQVDLAHLYSATELWSGLVKISPVTDGQALFVFAQHRDVAPLYRTLLKDSPTAISRALAPSTLVLALQKHLDNESDAITIPENLSESVIAHLVHSWGAMVERSFRRTQNSGEVQVGIGLLSCHYFSAGEHSLPFLLKRWNAEIKTEKKEKRKEGDVWDHSFDAGNSLAPDAENIDFDSIAFISKNADDTADNGTKGTQLNAQIINTSPGGYGISLETPPSTVQTGELIVIKENRMNQWSLGCIRWIRSQRNQPTQFGIELLAPKVEAVAVRILNKTGENGAYLRGMRLPALPAAGQEETIILPTMPFKPGSKAEWINDNIQQRIQLMKRTNASRSFVQYSFNSLTQVLNSSTNKDDSDDEFASIWDKL